MLSTISSVVECYQLDGVATSYNNSILDGIYSEPITQAELDHIQGYDDYDDFKHGLIAGPAMPANEAYMNGWNKNKSDYYSDWIEYCK